MIDPGVRHAFPMSLDHSVYPEMPRPPDDVESPREKADYLHRVCAAFDFGVFPEPEDWRRFAAWRDVFDEFPLPDSPAYHTFRLRFGWPSIPRGTCGLVPTWKLQDLREGRVDPCEHAV